MEMVLNNGFCEMTQKDICQINGGLYSIINGVCTVVYLVDLYNYQMETQYVTSYNETVIEAGRIDLVKSNPVAPEYGPLYGLK